MRADHPDSDLDPATAPSRPPGWGERLAALGGSPRAYVLVSILLLAPCYWQPRLQGGDLSSHIYNSWWARLIESGRAEGMQLVRQCTNILFELMLRGLHHLFGVEAAQRAAVSIAVLIFVWGAFAFIWVVSGRRPWYLMPSIAMLAYGWVYQMGFFNFYLSLGLCFWALVLGWEARPWRLAAAVPVLVLAFLGNVLPVVWAAALMTYLLLARHLLPRSRAYVSAGSLCVMVLLNTLVGRTMLVQWPPRQIAMSSGLEQTWMFDGKYYVVLVALLLIWGMLFLDLVRDAGARSVVSSVPFQLCIISAAGVVILPATILIPGLNHALVYIAERMSLGVGICLCAVLGAARPRLFERYALLAVAIVFFVFLYRDERSQNAFQDRMQDVVTQLNPVPGGEGRIPCETPYSKALPGFVPSS